MSDDLRTTRSQALSLQGDIEDALGVRLNLSESWPAGSNIWQLNPGLDPMRAKPVKELLDLQKAGTGKWEILSTGFLTWTLNAPTPTTDPKPHDVGGPLPVGTAEHPVDLTGAPINAGTGTFADKVRALDAAWTEVKSHARSQGWL